MKKLTKTDVEKLEHVRVSDLYREVDIKEYLNGRGVKFFPASGPWIKMTCPFPDHSDSTPSFYINTETGGYNCYGCHEHGHFYQLCETLGWEYELGENNLIGITTQTEWQRFKDNIQLDEIVTLTRHRKPVGFTFISQYDEKCKRHLAYCQRRGLDNLIKTFKIGYTIKTDPRYEDNYKNRLIIPVHNPHGKVVFFEGRRIDGIKRAKYWRAPGVRRDFIVFNLHRVLMHGFRWVIVVESVLTAMLLWHWGYPAVAVFGANISAQQSEQLMYFDDIYLCFDNDDAGNAGYKKASHLFVGLGSNIYKIVMPTGGQDACDIGQKRFEERLLKARNIY